MSINHCVRLLVLAGVIAFAPMAMAGTFKGDIAIDGVFDDWAGVPVLDSDALDNAGFIDFADVQIANDEDYLYIRVTYHTANSVGTYLAIDNDSNPGTGYDIFSLGLIGSEACWQNDYGFDQRTGWNVGGLTGGAANIGPGFWIEGNDKEYAISRAATFTSDSAPVFPNNSLTLMFWTDQGPDDVTSAIPYTFAEPPPVASGALLPKDLLIYYSWPTSINGAYSVAGAVNEFKQYDYVMLGDGLQDPGHGDHLNTIDIISQLHSVGNTLVFGYIAIGVSSQNLSMAEIQSRIDAWNAMGIDGIHLDEFGYDFLTSRDRQNAAVDYAHSLGLPVIANGFVPEDVFDSQVDPTYNPTGEPTSLNSSDFYLYESHQIMLNAYVDATTWQTKANALASYQDAIGFKMMSVTTTNVDDPGAYEEAKFFYAWYSALMYGHEATAWGEFNFSASGASNAQAPFRARPVIDSGDVFAGPVVDDNPMFTRWTDQGKIFVDTATPTAGFRALIFVDETATGANDGSSWTDAYTDLQDALSAATSGDEIWVADGTYKPAGAGGNRAATFQLISGVAIYGGFAGTETQRDQRDWDANAAILNGDLNGDDSGFTNNGENTYHVITGTGTAASAILDGFTITAGNADGSAADRFGGGLHTHTVGGGSCTLNNCTFSGNIAIRGGGGMHSGGGNPTLTNCTFSNNHATESSGDGGGLLCTEFPSMATLTGCTFTGNTAYHDGGGLRGFATMTDCGFVGNTANGSAGGAFVMDSRVTNCTFTQNSATMGGGLWADYSHVTGCIFFENSAGHGGGMVFGSSYSTSSVTNCTFTANVASGWGGAIYNYLGTTTVANCVLWGDTANNGDEIAICDGTLTISFSDIAGGAASAYIAGGAIIDGEGNINSNPLFSNPGSNDFHLSAGSPCIDTGTNGALPADTADLDGDGDTTEPLPLDLDGNPRVVNNIVDMGVYECLCDGCLIDEVCYGNGDPNPANECQYCDIAQSTSSWTNRSSGYACGDQSNTGCDNPNTCDGNGTCQDNFEPDTTECRAAVGDCDVAEACDGAGSCPADGFQPIDTLCGDQNDTTCTDPDTCDGVGVCLPNHAANGTLCEDGEYCTVDDECYEGLCDGSARDCGDGLDCTTDTCDEVGDSCVHTLDAGYCLIEDVCYSDGQANPANDCQYCDIAQSTTSWTNRSSGYVCGDQGDTVCDNPNTCDGNGACQDNFEPDTTECRAAVGDCDVAETCDGAGSCPTDAFQPSGTACGDDSDTVCDNPDTCDANGTCLDNFEPITTECRAAVDDCDVAETCDGAGSCPADGFQPIDTLCGDQDNTTCTAPDTCDGDGVCLPNHAANGTSCEDGEYCTVDDECYEGLCDGSARDCGDVLDCTTDTCDDVSDSCVHTLDADYCLIADVCYSDGQANPTNDCQYCDIAQSTTSWTNRSSGYVCGDQGDTVCDNPNTCDGNGACQDNFEP
ncbi:MAG: hypothetical protein KAV82_12095, partial [Phycisphaerae bacterium]|nr:hypothetical protein [Phycisphaerae bacterium]